MPCFYPIRAWKSPQVVRGRTVGYEIIFDERKGDAATELRLPCGQCDGCRLERARQWAVRCTHEASLYERNCFITLTYNDENLPYAGNLIYEDFQLFMKRLRKKFNGRTIRFFACGEYGEDNQRPHFHACLFNIDFDDRILFKTSGAGTKIYTSKTLDMLWSNKRGDSLGYATVGDVNFDSAGYVARYVLKKRTRGSATWQDYTFTDPDTGVCTRRNPEFIRMSLKPGIGSGWYDKFKSDLYPHDHCIVNGKQTQVPTYYKKKLAIENPDLYNQLVESHCIKSLDKASDNTEERLAVKEKVLQASMKFLKRELS